MNKTSLLSCILSALLAVFNISAAVSGENDRTESPAGTGAGPEVHVISISGEFCIDPETEIPDEAYRNNPDLVSIAVPDSVRRIGNRAFEGCTNLETVTIHASVVSIGEDAFADCNKLTLIVREGSFAAEYAETNGLRYELSQLPDPAASRKPDEYLYDILSDGTARITAYNGVSDDIVIPPVLDDHTVTEIGDFAFFDYRYLLLRETDLPAVGISPESISIPDTVTSIGSFAFGNRIGLTNIDIPDPVRFIGSEAFSHCVSLEEIRLPESLEVIGEAAFENCTGLKRISIPASVKTICRDPFYNCIALEEITVSPDNPYFGSTGCELFPKDPGR